MKTPDGKTYIYPDRDYFYGQCWSREQETDAMWRIYSPQENAVKVKTTIRKLANSLHDAVPGQKYNTCFIGSVKYLTRDKIEKMMTAGIPMADVTNKNGQTQVDHLLIKRIEFTHEAEVRLIFFKLSTDKAGKIYQYTIDPNQLYEEIVFDPRISKTVFEGYKKSINQCWIY